MILQSEIDQMNRHRRLKILLIILSVLLVAVVLFAVIRMGKEDIPVPAPTQNTMMEQVTRTSSEEVMKKLNELSSRSEGETPTAAPPEEEIRKKLDELSKTPEGTAPLTPSQEEIMKKLNALK